MRRSCGSVGISPRLLARISKGRVGRVEHKGLIFQAFHGTAFSTLSFVLVFVLALGCSSVFTFGFPPADYS